MWREKLDTITKKLELERFNQNKVVSKISTTIKLKPEYVTLILLTLAVLFFLATPWGHLILISFFTYIYPSYKSFRALQSEDHSDNKRWMIYWIVYGLIYSFEVMISGLLQVRSFLFLMEFWRQDTFGFLVLKEFFVLKNIL